MNETLQETVVSPSTRSLSIRDWHRWTPYAAPIWSLVYALITASWAISGRGYPFAPAIMSEGMVPFAGRLGPDVAWALSILAGFPAALVGAVMLRELHSRALRSFLIAYGILLTGVLLLLMTGLNLLVLFGYIPFLVFNMITGGKIGPEYLAELTRWSTLHQVFCLPGGFLWAAATVCYTRRSGGACLYCGCKEGRENQRSRIVNLGRPAVYVSLIPPLFYALTRIAWAVGIPLGITRAVLQQGQEAGTWTSGLFLAAFGLVGALLTLGLIQRWGEVFPRWMIGLSGRRVPPGLAIVPATLISVLLVVGGLAIWSGLPGMIATVEHAGARGFRVFYEVAIQVGPTLLFPVWGAALAVATVSYSHRRRGSCPVCVSNMQVDPV